MANELVVGGSFNDQMRLAGQELLEGLDREDCKINAAFWFYFSDQEEWKFLVCTPLVRDLGPRELYRKVDQLNNLLNTPISLQSIVWISSDHFLVELLQKAIQTGDGISGIRFSKNTINGQLIDDAFIYRMRI